MMQQTHAKETLALFSPSEGAAKGVWEWACEEGVAGRECERERKHFAVRKVVVNRHLGTACTILPKVLVPRY